MFKFINSQLVCAYLLFHGPNKSAIDTGTGTGIVDDECIVVSTKPKFISVFDSFELWPEIRGI